MGEDALESKVGQVVFGDEEAEIARVAEEKIERANRVEHRQIAPMPRAA